MTDTRRLEEKIAMSGLKLSYIANELGITYYSLSQKIHNKTEFKASEIKAMCNLLRINNLKEKEAIFFTTEVDK